MGYAPEKVGLNGSKEIARAYKNSGKKVVAVLQLDRTAYKNGSAALITDPTNRTFNSTQKQLNYTHKSAHRFG